MSKFGLILGLAFSFLLHGWLLLRPITPVVLENGPVEIAVVDVVKVPKKGKQLEVKEVVRKTAKPVEKIETKTPPVTATIPKLVDSGKSKMAKEHAKGDFAGTSDGVYEPVVRIDWGDMDRAVVLLKSSGMRLVVYEPDGSVTKEVVLGDDVFTLAALQIKPSQRYSDNLRIVDQVPAFAPVRKSLRLPSSKRLAVLVPVNIERMVESAKISEASRRGLFMKDIKILGGRFDLAGDRVSFVIDKIQLRS